MSFVTGEHLKMPLIGRFILTEYSNSILSAQSNKGLPFGNPLFYLAEA